jgi:hypothetical protein
MLENTQIVPIYGLHLIFVVLASGTIIDFTGGTELRLKHIALSH